MYEGVLMGMTVETWEEVTLCLPSSHERIHGRRDTSQLWEDYTVFRKTRGGWNLDTRLSMCKGTAAREAWTSGEASVMSITSQKAVAAAGAE